VRPAELLSGPPEVVYLNPRHRETVLSHLRCAAEELPLDPEKDQQYWGGDLEGLLKELSEREDMGDDGREVLVLNKRGEAANEVKLRSLGFECKVFDDAGKELARPDVLRAMRRFHKYARFQIQEKAYEVSRLSINWGMRNAEGTARLLDHLDYTTAPVILTECEVLEETDSRKINGTALLSRGGVKFNIHVDGYYKVPTGAGDPKYQHLGPAAPPKYEIETDGLWFTLPTTSLAAIDAADHEASMSSALEALRISAALLCSTDPDDVGHHLDSSDASAFVLYLADKVAGGNGLTEQVYHQAKELVAGALRVLTDCPHCSATTGSRGCARCVTTPWGQDDAVCRDGGITILKLLFAGL
jgi:DEAD/DEAH box helicase domain-containing protein